MVVLQSCRFLGVSVFLVLLEVFFLLSGWPLPFFIHLTSVGNSAWRNSPSSPLTLFLVSSDADGAVIQKSVISAISEESYSADPR